MRRHTKVYLEKLGFDDYDFIPCEVCRQEAQDIHHINSRGMGGSMLIDKIENLMALCRKCHEKYGDKSQFMTFLVEIHDIYMKIRRR